MKRSARPPGRSPLTFFFLAFALAIPFLVIGALTRIQLLLGYPWLHSWPSARRRLL
jgi:hypothetical protein